MSAVMRIARTQLALMRIARIQLALVRIARTLLALVLFVGGLLIALAPVGGPAAADGGSAVTVGGSGDYTGLKVTVSQTTGLIDQDVEVTWTGGRPTAPSHGNFATDYLQIMQCWGDDPAGPQREQCQFGAARTDGRGGNWANSRQVSYGADLVDPRETYKQVPGTFDQAFVPFRSVTGATDTGSTSEFFDANTTNELPYARTRGDGTGDEFFEVQTVVEAPGLGCGDVETVGAAPKPRDCWLVVVPRGATEVDGTTVPNSAQTQLASSALAQSNWDHRIVIPLHFQEIGQACPIGAKERRTIGSEFITEAMLRWQPALCAGGGTTYGFSQTSDDVARASLAESPGLAFVGSPLSPDEIGTGKSPVYAPVAVSGLTIAFDIDRQTQATDPEEVRKDDGKRIPEVDLTPRLVAKLLTESYGSGAFISEPALAKNPQNLSDDPDFLAVNPAFNGLAPLPLGDAFVPLVSSDSTSELWTWVSADADARAFLDGTPDPFGMTVNPAYKGLPLPVGNYPKKDKTCVQFVNDPPPPQVCIQDAHPYANDMHDAARSNSRGDTKANTDVNVNVVPPVLKKVTPQLPGLHSMMSVTDAATAARYGLLTAKLRNASGAFVGATPDSLTAGVAAMKPSGTAGFLAPDPQTTDPAAYPLTTVTYAATVPADLDATSAADYAHFLTYVTDHGQAAGVEVGQLPAGYAPLPAAMRTQAAAAAATIVANAGRTSPPGSAGTPETTGTGGGTATTAAATGVPAAGAVPAPATPSGGPSLLPVGVADVRATPAAPVGAVRYVLAILLLLGALAAGIGPALLGHARRRRR